MLYSSSNKKSFQNLTRISIDINTEVYFAYDSKSTRLINTSCKKLNPKDPFYCTDDELSPGIIVAKYKHENISDSLAILYSEGMSVDPEFTII